MPSTRLFGMTDSTRDQSSEMAWKLARHASYSIESMRNQLKDEILYTMSQYLESSTDREAHPGVVSLAKDQKNMP